VLKSSFTGLDDRCVFSIVELSLIVRVVELSLIDRVMELSLIVRVVERLLAKLYGRDIRDVLDERSR
jgi:hypothetical protein